MKGVLLQPTYLPWMGYFELVQAADLFVVLDHVQFEKQSWQQRNRIKTLTGELMLSVPVRKYSHKSPIYDIIVSDPAFLVKKHWKSITQAYCSCPFFDKFGDSFMRIYQKEHKYLRDLNCDFINNILLLLNIDTPIIFSSTLQLIEENLTKNEKIIQICKRLNIDTFYEPAGGQDFIDPHLFQQNGITVEFQNYSHPLYRQAFDGFIPYMSAIDLLFNEGHASLDILLSGRVQ